MIEQGEDDSSQAVHHLTCPTSCARARLVPSFAQALHDVSAISLRRAIRELPYGESLAGEFLKAREHSTK